MLYKDLVDYVHKATTLSNKEVKLVLSKVKLFIRKCVAEEKPFKWKGLLSLKFVTLQATRKVLKGEVINVPTKKRVRIKLGR